MISNIKIPSFKKIEDQNEKSYTVSENTQSNWSNKEFLLISLTSLTWVCPKHVICPNSSESAIAIAIAL